MSWTIEDRLLLDCCRSEIDDKIKKRLTESERKGADWNFFLEKARENGISALVYSRLKAVNKDCSLIPAIIFEELKKDYYLNAAKNSLILEELGKALETFRRAGFQVMALKGAALAEKVYGNIALRPMADVDLLVRKENLISLDEKLKMLGYWPADMPVNDIDFSSTYLTTLDYQKTSGNSASFHIHWHFVNSTIPSESYIKNIKIENIWKDAEKTSVAGVETLAMAPHHLLIHLSEHSLRVTHSLSKFIFFCDINEATNSYLKRLDWDRLIKECFSFNLNRMVYISLYLTSEFLGTKIPEDVLRKLRPERFTPGEKIFLNMTSNNNRFPGLSYLVHLSMNRGMFKKIKFAARTLFPPLQVIAQRNYLPRSKVSSMDYLRRITEVSSHLFKILK